MSVVTVTTRTRAESKCSCSRPSDGISSLHGPHQVAQKFKSTTFPIRSAERSVPPSSAFRSNVSSGLPVGTRLTRSATNGSIDGSAPDREASKPNVTAYPAMSARRNGRYLLRPMTDDLRFGYCHGRQLHDLDDETMRRHRVFLPPHDDGAVLVDGNEIGRASCRERV